MTNSFINLTTDRGRSMQINVNHIVGIQDQAPFTYILLNNTGVNTVHVKENYGKVVKMIANAFGRHSRV